MTSERIIGFDLNGIFDFDLICKYCGKGASLSLKRTLPD